MERRSIRHSDRAVHRGPRAGSEIEADDDLAEFRAHAWQDQQAAFQAAPARARVAVAASGRKICGPAGLTGKRFAFTAPRWPHAPSPQLVLLGTSDAVRCS